MAMLHIYDSTTRPTLPSGRQLGPTGSTKSSTTAFGLWAAWTQAVRLITRNGNDLTRRFPFIAMALAALPSRSCLIDSEAIMCDEPGSRCST